MYYISPMYVRVVNPSGFTYSGHSVEFGDFRQTYVSGMVDIIHTGTSSYLCEYTHSGYWVEVSGYSGYNGWVVSGYHAIPGTLFWISFREFNQTASGITTSGPDHTNEKTVVQDILDGHGYTPPSY